MRLTWSVQGMTCAHCVAAVTAELEGLPGVTSVVVDLTSGTATVEADPMPSDDAVRAAVGEAGYTLG